MSRLTSSDASERATIPMGANAHRLAALGRLPRGAEVGRYVVLECVASGAMGVVYAAYDPNLHRKVALKILRTDIPGVDPVDMRNRFLREAQAMARLSHPNVVPVHDVGSVGELVFMAMEFVEGTTLSHWLTLQPRSWQEVRDVFVLAGRGLAAAHAASLVHRDFKPENVLVGEGGRVLVSDFGLVRPMADLRPGPQLLPRTRMGDERSYLSEMTEPRVLMGTPLYMAPEQHERAPADERADQFSFCVALYDGLFHHPPFAGGTREAIHQEMLAGRIQLPGAKSAVPKWVRRALLKGLSVDPQGRFESMAELLEALTSPPWYTRRRTYYAVALSLGVVAAASVYDWAVTRRSSVCQGAERRLAGIWDASRRADVKGAFVRASPSQGERMFVEVDRLLHGYSQRWVREHTDACEATRLRGEQSEALLDLRMQCLERRKQELGALVALLGGASAEIVDEAPGAASKLTSPGECAQVEALQFRQRRPSEPAISQKIHEVEEGLVQVKVLHDSARYVQALDRLPELKSRAAEAGHRATQSEVQLWEGTLLLQLGRWREAKPLLFESAWAAEASGQDRLAVRAWVGLMYIAGYNEGRFEEAERYYRQAGALLERLGNDPLLSGALQSHWGVVLDENGRYAEAEKVLVETVAQRERTVGAEHPETVLARSRLANVLVNLGRPEEAVPVLQSVLAFRRARFGDGHRLLISSYVNITNAMSLAGDYEGAMPYAQKAVELSSQHRTNGIARSAPLSNLAELLFLRGELEQAEALSREALGIVEKQLSPGHYRVADDLRVLGDIARLRGDTRAALELHGRALKALESARGPESPLLAAVLVSLGKDHLTRRNPKAALSHLERAWERVKNAEGQLARAEVQGALAEVLWEASGRRAEAVAHAEAARDIYAKRRREPERLRTVAWLDKHRLH